MYRLPENTDLGFLEGTTLLQICVGVNEFILHFDGDARITLLGEFEVLGGQPAKSVLVRGPEETPVLLPMLHDVVKSALPTRAGGLELTFESGSRLAVPDDSDEYESFLIEGPGIKIIV